MGATNEKIYKIKSSRSTDKILNVIIFLLVVIWTLATLLPFVFMVLNSVKEQFDLLYNGAFAWPEVFYVENYQEVISGDFFTYFKNSVIVLVISLVGLLFIAACAAYPLSRFKLKSGKIVLAIIVACMSIPVHITLIPIFKMSQTLNVYDTIWGLIAPYIAICIPISVFILTGFMEQIPLEIEESAQIDGANVYKIFFSIIIPLCKPGIATLIIYNGVAMWNEFIFAYTLTQSAENRTLPLAVWEFQGQYLFNTPLIMAVLVLTLLPMLILFAICKDQLIKGMTAGAVKG